MVPQTGFEIVAGDLAQLVILVRRHLVVNKLEEPANLAALIEHWICLNVPESFCKGEYEEGDQQKRLAAPAAIRDASMIRFLRLGRQLDTILGSGQEAERRAEICSQCHLNAKGVCTNCRGLATVAPDMLQGRSTTWDPSLGVCAVDLCILRVKCFIRGEILIMVSRPNQEGEYPAACWVPQLTKETDHG